LVAQESQLPAPPLPCAWDEHPATHARQVFRQEFRAHLSVARDLTFCGSRVAPLVSRGTMLRVRSTVRTWAAVPCPSGAIPHPGTMIMWPTNRWGLTVAAAAPKCLFPHMCHDYARVCACMTFTLALGETGRSRCSARVRQSIEFRIKLRELIFPYRLEVSQSLSASTPG
jgi:hypothetical protein